MSQENSGFPAHAFNPDLGNEAIPGRILFDRWLLRFTSGTVIVEIPLVRLQIEFDEAAGGPVCFSDPNQPDWSIHTLDARILKVSGLLQQTHTRRQINELQSRGELKRRLLITLACLVGFAVIAAVTTVLMGLMVRSLVQKVPAEWEKQVGDGLIAELKVHETFVEDTKQKSRLSRAVAPLIAALPGTNIDFNFYIVQERLPNAFALPGGHVLVTTGLLDLADRPEELSGVIAHEIAHVTQKHGFRKIISDAGPYLVFRIFLGNQNGLLGILGNSSELLIRQSFSQEYELEADAVGWQYLVSARIDPRAMVDILKKLKAEQERRKHSDAEIRAFNSHPATEKRIERLEQKWKKLKNKTGFIDIDP